MTDKRLLVFCTLAECLSFGETARRLGISQPAVSRHIATLEAEMGAALLVRHGRRVMLTDKGRALLPVAKGILQAYAALDNLRQ